MPTWEALTLATDAVTGKNSTDRIFTASYDNGIIPAEDERLQEAKKLVKRRLVSKYGSWVVQAGGADQLLQKASEDAALSGLLNDALAEAYLFYYYNSNFSERGDRFWESRETADQNVTEAVSALMGVAPAQLGLTTSGGSGTSSVRGSSLGLSSWGY